MTDEELPAGSELAGRYEVRTRLGAGGMGVVYEVLDRVSLEPIALKTLRRGIADPQHIKREFRALADITHPNLVQLYDLFDASGLLCLTMELVRGVDLMTELRGADLAAHTATFAATLPDGVEPAPIAPGVGEFWPPPDLPAVRDRFAQLARGLDALHGKGIVHRDIKPHNVRVTPEGRLVLLDFGLATVAGDAGPLAGTLAYMAPEQASGAPVHPAADWYSFGILLHEVLTGKVPWTGTAHEVLRRKRQGGLESLRGHAGVPDDLAALVDALVHPDPDRRITGDEVLDRLGQRAQPRIESEHPSNRGLIGRRAELAQLVAAWRVVETGGSAWLAIDGGSGVGKTTLLAALENVATVTLHGRCYEREAIAYKGIDQIVDELVARLVALRVPCPEAAELVAAFPVASELAGVELSAQHAHLGHDRRGAALRALIARLAAETPVLIALDDIQWADRDCLNLLAHTLAPPGLPRVMIVVTARPGETARWLELPMPFARIRLGTLPESDAAALAQSLLGRAALQIDGLALARRAGGHPLEVVERVRAALADASSEAVDASAARELVIDRVAAATAEVRLVVHFTAIAGAPIPAAALGAAMGVPEPTLRAALDRAQLAGLVKSRRLGGRVVVESAHDQVREVVFAALSGRERAALASALAPALETFGHEPAHVAELYVLACMPDAARRCAIHAAERMTQLGGHDAAAVLWRQVAELSSGDARETARTRHADSLTLAGRGSEAAAIYRELAITASGDDRLRLVRRAAEELLRTGRIAEGLDLIETSLGWRDRGGSLALVTALARHAATRAGLTPRRGTAPTREELELQWSAIAGHTLGSPGQFVTAVERHLRAALRSGEPDHISLAWSAEATLAVFLGSRAFADTALARSAAALRDLDAATASRARAIATATAALVQLDAGMWRRAEQVAEMAAELFDRWPNLVWERNTSSVVGTIARLHRGDLAGLARGTRRERERIAACGDLYAHEIAHSGFSVVAELVADEPARADATIAQLVGRPTGIMNGWLRVVAHGLIGSYGSRPEWHRARADALLTGHLSIPLLRSPLVLGTILWTRATLAVVCGDNPTRYLDRLRRLHARGTRGLAELLAGHAALVAGDRDRARAAGAAAELLLEADEMTQFAASARWLVDPGTWPAWSESLAKQGAVNPAALARVFAPGLARS